MAITRLFNGVYDVLLKIEGGIMELYGRLFLQRNDRDFEHDELYSTYQYLNERKERINRDIKRSHYDQLVKEYPTLESLKLSKNPEILRNISSVKQQKLEWKDIWDLDNLENYLHQKICQQIIDSRMANRWGTLKEEFYSKQQLLEVNEIDKESNYLSHQLEWMVGYEEDDSYKNARTFSEFNALFGYIEKHMATEEQMLEQQNISLPSDDLDEFIEKLELINTSWEEYKELADSLDENRWFDSDSKAVQHLKDQGKPTPFELAETLLPTTPGPFFGSQDYDSSYFYHVSDLLSFLKESRDKWITEDYGMIYSMHY